MARNAGRTAGAVVAPTGGQIFIAVGLEAGGITRQAIEAMRRPHVVATPITAALEGVDAIVGGMHVGAAWRERPEADPGLLSRAAATVAASVALRRLAKDAA